MDLNEEIQPVEARLKLAEHIRKDLSKGRDKGIIIEELVRSNWDTKEAEQFVIDVSLSAENIVLTPEESAEIRYKVGRYAKWGIFWCLFGGIMSIVSYWLAAPGKTYTVMYGAILVGVHYFVRSAILRYQFKHRLTDK